MNEGLARAQSELERLVRVLSEKVWLQPLNIRLPMPVVTIQSGGRKRAVGWFIEDVWGQKNSKENLPELNVSAEHLREDPHQIAETIIHELVHLYNWVQGRKDSTINGYHNKQFRRGCENVGLICENRRDGRGWAHTKMTPELRKIVDEIGIDEEAFALFRREHKQLKSKKDKKKHRKYTCGCRGVNNVLRAWDSPLRAQCNDCEQRFESTEPSQRGCK